MVAGGWVGELDRAGVVVSGGCVLRRRGSVWWVGTEQARLVICGLGG